MMSNGGEHNTKTERVAGVKGVNGSEASKGEHLTWTENGSIELVCSIDHDNRKDV